jgi:hypothetical protein
VYARVRMASLSSTGSFFLLPLCLWGEGDSSANSSVYWVGPLSLGSFQSSPILSPHRKGAGL